MQEFAPKKKYVEDLVDTDNSDPPSESDDSDDEDDRELDRDRELETILPMKFR